jgi:hypothetical protein
VRVFFGTRRIEDSPMHGTFLFNAMSAILNHAGAEVLQSEDAAWPKLLRGNSQ